LVRGESGIAFSMPGGDASGPARSRPVDLAHLARQTMGDRALEQEVLALFVQQALSVRDKIIDADVRERLPENHLAWFVIDAVGVMDTAAFYAA